MPENNPGVFSGQYGSDADWLELQKAYATARQQWRTAHPDGIGNMMGDVAAALGLSEDEVKAIDQMASNRERGLSTATWTREDLWRRVANAPAKLRQKAEADAAAAAQAEQDKARGGVEDRIKKFLADLDPNSPTTQAMYQYISKRGQATQGAASARAGLGSAGSGQGSGGLSAYGQQMVQGDLANKYDMQRNALQAQGLGMLSQHDLGIKQLELGYMEMQNKQAEQAWAARQNQNQGIGAAFGGALGALGFIGGPALGAATMRGGAALGGGLGGLAAGGSGPSYPSMPSWMSGSGRKGSLGGSGY